MALPNGPSPGRPRGPQHLPCHRVGLSRFLQTLRASQTGTSPPPAKCTSTGSFHISSATNQVSHTAGAAALRVTGRGCGLGARRLVDGHPPRSQQPQEVSTLPPPVRPSGRKTTPPHPLPKTPEPRHHPRAHPLSHCPLHGRGLGLLKKEAVDIMENHKDI